jgi:5'-3' exonuclease
MEIKIDIKDMVRLRNFQDIEFYAIPAKFLDKLKKENETFENAKIEVETKAQELEAQKLKEEEEKALKLAEKKRLVEEKAKLVAEAKAKKEAEEAKTKADKVAKLKAELEELEIPEV